MTMTTGPVIFETAVMRMTVNYRQRAAVMGV
jgi:hypothetical protein